MYVNVKIDKSLQLLMIITIKASTFLLFCLDKRFEFFCKSDTLKRKRCQRPFFKVIVINEYMIERTDMESKTELEQN